MFRGLAERGPRSSVGGEVRDVAGLLAIKRTEPRTEGRFDLSFGARRAAASRVYSSLKLVVSNGPSGLEAPDPLGFAESKVLGLNRRGSSDS
jgi:hypothetical protein